MTHILHSFLSPTHSVASWRAPVESHCRPKCLALVLRFSPKISCLSRLYKSIMDSSDTQILLNQILPCKSLQNIALHGEIQGLIWKSFVTLRDSLSSSHFVLLRVFHHVIPWPLFITWWITCLSFPYGGVRGGRWETHLLPQCNCQCGFDALRSV